jgi:predicted amidohydrolase YtcJ
MTAIRLKSGLLLCVFLLLPCVALSQAPDRILHDGKILTVDQKFSVASAIAIRGERIIAVGDTAAIRKLAGPATVLTDLQGRTVIPGLIDNHLHYLRGSNFMPYEARLDGVLTRKEALERISARARELGPGTSVGKWIFVIGGWHEQQFRDKPGGFSQEELDQAAPNNPVYIQKTYSDFYMNSLAIKAIAPAIGPLYKGSAHVRTSNFDGRKVLYAALKYMPRATSDDKPTDKPRVAGDFGVEEWIVTDMNQRMREVKTFNTQLNSLGLTTVYDVGYLDGPYEPVQRLLDKGELTARVFYPLQYYIRTPDEVPATVSLILREKPLARNHWFGVLGMGEHVYGPLHDSAFNPKQVFPQDYYNQFYKLALAAAKRGWQIHEHTAVDSTVRGLLALTEEIAKEYPIRDLRWTLAHVDVITPETLERAKRQGWVIAVHNKVVKPVQRGYDDADSPPIRMIQNSGVLWGMGSDGTVVSTINPFQTIWQYTAGKIFPDIVAYKNVITREEALIAHTRSNAYLLFMEKDIGTLESGKLADLVVLDRDYMTIPVDDILGGFNDQVQKVKRDVS